MAPLGRDRYRATVTPGSERPLLFLDVDGPLIPLGGWGSPSASGASSGGATDEEAWDGTSNPLLSRLNPTHGKRLTTLGCELIWATTWMTDANDDVAPRLGLPQLPILDPSDDAEQEQPIRGLHWKTIAMVAWAAGRPFIWVDDEISDVDRAWVTAHHPGRALLHRVDPRVGLTDQDFDAIDQWLTTHATPNRKVI
jgi:HAD domain in Swiss Army Knife RNA repair proteins